MTTLIIKQGVQPPLLWIIPALLAVADEMGVPEITITSGIDGRHSQTSKHYQLGALDVRRWNLDDPDTFVANLQRRLGPKFDVVLEETHIHVEFDHA